MDVLAAKSALLEKVKAGVSRLEDAEKKLTTAKSSDEIAALRQEIRAAKESMTAAVDEINQRLDQQESRSWDFKIVRDDQGLIADVIVNPVEAQ